jgi:hypothetical protein
MEINKEEIRDQRGLALGNRKTAERWALSTYISEISHQSHETLNFELQRFLQPHQSHRPASLTRLARLTNLMRFSISCPSSKCLRSCLSSLICKPHRVEMLDLFPESRPSGLAKRWCNICLRDTLYAKCSPVETISAPEKFKMSHNSTTIYGVLFMKIWLSLQGDDVADTGYGAQALR